MLVGAPLSDTLQSVKVEIKLKLLIRPGGKMFVFVHMVAPQHHNKGNFKEHSSLLQH